VTTLTLKSGDHVELADDEPFELLHAPRGTVGASVRGGTFGRILGSTGASFTAEGFTLRMGPVPTTRIAAIRLVTPMGVVLRGARCEGWIADMGVPETATALDATGMVIGRPAGTLLSAEQGGDGLVIEDMIGRDFHRGLTFGKQHRVLNRAVALSGLRTTGWRGGLGNDCLFDGISYTDADPWRYGRDGDHGDFFHPWTDTGWATHGLTLRDATFSQGIGYPLMGVYLDDNQNRMGFHGTLLERVTVMSGHGQGFLLENVHGALRDCMTIWSRRGSRGLDDARDTPRFNLNKGSRVSMAGCVGPVVVEAGSEIVA
jgi:hypothetical protein